MTRAALRGEFERHFGGSPPIVVRAPGRVNLIGEHTDYNDGWVFPAAIDRYVAIAARPSNGPSRMISLQKGRGEEFWAGESVPGTVDDWTRYPQGVAWAIKELGHHVSNIDAVVDSDLPMATGVSSSAAIEMACVRVWEALVGLHLTPTDRARIGRRCENEFIGLQSGIMDQLASAAGRVGHALLLDTVTLVYEYAPIPPEWQIAVLDTGFSRELAGSAYNQRKAICDAAKSALGLHSWRAIDQAGLERRNGQLTELEFRRARHVITENVRAREFAGALANADAARVGQLMRESHESLRVDYEVTVPALDEMAWAAWHTPGCVGARMTGAGFGGACVALVEREKASAFVEQANDMYRRAMEKNRIALGESNELLPASVIELVEPAAGADSWPA
jgi:galactokinase